MCFYDSRYFCLRFQQGDQMEWRSCLPDDMQAALDDLVRTAETPEEQIGMCIRLRLRIDLPDAIGAELAQEKERISALRQVSLMQLVNRCRPDSDAPLQNTFNGILVCTASLS